MVSPSTWPRTGLSNHARTAFDKLTLNGWLCNSFSITYATLNNPRDYAWLLQRQSMGYPD